MIISLIRFALIAPAGDAGTEPTPPIGLAYIAGMCKDADLDVDVNGIDAAGRNLNKIFKIPKYSLRGNGLEVNEIIQLINPKTKIIGISSMFSHEWPYVRDCIELVKKSFPNAKIIVGGENVTALPEYSLRDCNAVDYISLGEGEETWLEIIKKKGNDIDNIAGLAYLKNGEFIKTDPRKRIQHIDKIPWPDWSAFPIEPYLDNAVSFGPGSGRNMPILASRGCPYECTFCSNPLMFGRRYFVREINDLIRQIKYYIEKYKITGLQFYDLTAIVKKKWVIEFCEALKENNINLEWSLPSGTRSEALDLEVIQALASVNLKYLVYAPESGSAKTLELIKKKIKIPAVEKSIKYAVSQGIVVRTNLIIGFPGETRSQLYKTLYQQIKFAFMGVEDAPTYYFNAYPGTELFDQLLKEKKIKLGDDYFHSLATLSHYNLSPTNTSYNEYMGRYELYFYRMIGMMLAYSISYLFRPKRILRTIKSIFRDDSATVVEQRFKDFLRKSNLFTKHIKPFVLKIFVKKSI